MKKTVLNRRADLNEWHFVKLSTVVERLTNGYVGATRNIYCEDGIPYLLARHVRDNSLNFDSKTFVSSKFNQKNKKSILKTGDVLLVQSGHIGHSAVVPDDHQGHNCHAMIVITPVKDKLLGKFLSLYFNSTEMRRRFLDIRTGSTVPHLNCRDVNNIVVPLPTLSEQKRIVSILDEAFEGIDQAIVNTEKNLANARELFENYLTKVFTQKGDEWEEKKFGDICNIKHGFAFKSEFFEKEGDFVLLTPGSFYESGGFRDQGEKTKYYVGEIPEGYILDERDFLIAMTEQAVGLLGSSLIVPESNRFLHNQRLGLVEVKEGIQWDNDFFHHQLNTKFFRDSVQSTASGVKVRHTSPIKLSEIPVHFPKNLFEQTRIARNLNVLKSQVSDITYIYRQKLSALKKLKQSILQKAFTGELTKDYIHEMVN